MRTAFFIAALALLCNLARVEGHYYYWNATNSSPDQDINTFTNYAYFSGSPTNYGGVQMPLYTTPLITDLIYPFDDCTTFCSACNIQPNATVLSPAFIGGIFWDPTFSVNKCPAGISIKVSSGTTQMGVMWLPYMNVNSTVYLSGGNFQYGGPLYNSNYGCFAPWNVLNGAYANTLRYATTRIPCFVFNSTVEVRAATTIQNEPGLAGNLVFSKDINIVTTSGHTVTYKINDTLIYFNGNFNTQPTAGSSTHIMQTLSGNSMDVYYGGKFNVQSPVVINLYNARCVIDGAINVNMFSTSRSLTFYEKAAIVNMTLNGPITIPAGNIRFQLTNALFNPTATITMTGTQSALYINPATPSGYAVYNLKGALNGGIVHVAVTTIYVAAVTGTNFLLDGAAGAPCNAQFLGPITNATLVVNAMSTAIVFPTSQLSGCAVTNAGQIIFNAPIYSSTISLTAASTTVFSIISDSTINIAAGSTTTFANTVANSIINLPSGSTTITLMQPLTNTVIRYSILSLVNSILGLSQFCTSDNGCSTVLINL